MRCQYCGWDNQPNATACTKCGQPLPVGSAAPAAPVAEPQVAASSADRATVVFRRGEMPSSQQKQTVAAPRQSACPVCGYPATGGDTNCPMCGASLVQAAPPAPAVAKPIVQQPSLNETVVQSPHVEQPTVRFNPNAMPSMSVPEPQPSQQQPYMEQPTVRFNPDAVPVMPAPGVQPSRPQPVAKGVFSPLPAEFQSQPPVVACEDGRWFVEAQNNAAVLLQVTRRMEIQPGDILLVDGRRFQFEVTEA